jgi:hypothetical protein
LGASASQIKVSIRNIKEEDNKRTLIMIQKNLVDTHKDESTVIPDLYHASDLATDLGDEDRQLVPKDKSPVWEEKILKVYKRREKVVPKVVRRSIRLSKKYKSSN